MTVAAVLLGLLAPAGAHAQGSHAGDDQWLIVPSVVTGHGDPKHPSRAAGRQLSLHFQEQGQRTIPTDLATTRFEQRGSAPPMQASAADIDELARDAQRALYHVASGLHSRAKQDVERALGRARKALESLNRETRAAQHLLDTCLYLVRAHLQRGKRADARRQALECRRLVPDIAPEPTLHPPDVIGVFAEAQAQLNNARPASLRIASEPTGCAAYVNGRNLGPTPRELSRLSPGEYRVQVECTQGLMGRVHRVALTDRHVLTVDTRYDAAIGSLFDLSLSYGSGREQQQYLQHDAVETARVVGAAKVVTTWVVENPATPAPPGTSIVQADHYRVSDGLHIASVRLAVPVDQSDVSRPILEGARVALVGGKSVDLSSGTAVPLKLDAEPPLSSASVVAAASSDASARAALPADDAQRDVGGGRAAHVAAGNKDDGADEGATDALTITGYVVGGLALGTQVAGWVAYSQLVSAHDVYAGALAANDDPMVRTSAELTALRLIDERDALPPIALGVGGIVGAAAVPLWLPASEGMAWYVWTAGGVGLALAAGGAVLTAQAGSCDRDRYDRCTDAPLATDMGPLLLMQAVPLLSLPATQAVRALLDDDGARVEVSFGRTQGMLRVGGTL